MQPRGVRGGHIGQLAHPHAAHHGPHFRTISEMPANMLCLFPSNRVGQGGSVLPSAKPWEPRAAQYWLQFVITRSKYADAYLESVTIVWVAPDSAERAVADRRRFARVSDRRVPRATTIAVKRGQMAH